MKVGADVRRQLLFIKLEIRDFLKCETLFSLIFYCFGKVIFLIKIVFMLKCKEFLLYLN